MLRVHNLLLVLDGYASPGEPIGDDVQESLGSGHVVVVAGSDASQVYRAGSVAERPRAFRSQVLRSARWSARVLPDHLRETRTRRQA